MNLPRSVDGNHDGVDTEVDQTLGFPGEIGAIGVDAAVEVLRFDVLDKWHQVAVQERLPAPEKDTGAFPGHVIDDRAQGGQIKLLGLVIPGQLVEQSLLAPLPAHGAAQVAAVGHHEGEQPGRRPTIRHERRSGPQQHAFES